MQHTRKRDVTFLYTLSYCTDLHPGQLSFACDRWISLGNAQVCPLPILLLRPTPDSAVLIHGTWSHTLDSARQKSYWQLQRKGWGVSGVWYRVCPAPGGCAEADAVAGFCFMKYLLYAWCTEHMTSLKGSLQPLSFSWTVPVMWRNRFRESPDHIASQAQATQLVRHQRRDCYFFPFFCHSWACSLDTLELGVWRSGEVKILFLTWSREVERELGPVETVTTKWEGAWATIQSC